MKKKIIQKIGGAILAFATIASLFFGVYTLFNEKKPNILARVIGNIDVLEINRDIDNLSILYDGDDIAKNNKRLNIYKIRIENNGQADILQNMYDQSQNFGIRIMNAKPIKEYLTDASTQYILQNVHLHEIDNDLIFNKIIFEKNSFFEFEVLVLYDKAIEPSFAFMGKIAGIDSDKIHVIPLTKNEKINFWQTVFNGSLTVQIIRFVIYFIISIAITILGIFLIVTISDKHEENIKERRSNFFDKKTKQLKLSFSFIKKYYVAEGKKGLDEIYELISSEKNIRDRMVLHKSHLNIDLTDSGTKNDEMLYFEMDKMRMRNDLLTKLTECNAIRFLNNKIDINQNFVNELTSIMILMNQ